jgi:Tfp pilus assembly protein FimV
VVRPGDSLWAIAQRMLDAGAPSVRVAALVDRLWNANRRRIGTGSPDRLRVGVTLLLPDPTI